MKKVDEKSIKKLLTKVESNGIIQIVAEQNSKNKKDFEKSKKVVDKSKNL